MYSYGKPSSCALAPRNDASTRTSTKIARRIRGDGGGRRLLERFRRVDDGLGRDAELLVHDVAGRRETEARDGDDLAVQADIAVPEFRHTGLDRDAAAARAREHALLVRVVLGVEALHARHRDDTHAG